MTKELYCSGQYALVDPYYRHVWLNIRNEAIAHCIREIFWSKIPLIVFDLSQFDNYIETLIDNSVSLDWKIGPDYAYSVATASLLNPTLSKTQISYSSTKLINEPNHSPLPVELQKNLQYQLMLCQFMMEPIINLKDSDIKKSLSIIFQKELSTDNIIEAIYQLAIKFDNLSWSRWALEFLDRKYE